MDWGGIIASALGGGAQAVGQIADDNIKQRDFEAADIRRGNREEARDIRRLAINEQSAMRTMDLKLGLEEKQRKLRSTLLSGNYDDIEKEAGQIDKTRSLAGLQTAQTGVITQGQKNTVTGQPIQTSPSATPDELSALIADPNNRKVYEDAGYIPKTTGSSLVKDRMNAARSVGADPEIRKELRDEFTSTTRAESEAESNANKKREIERKESRDDFNKENATEQTKIASRKADALIARAMSSGGGSDKGAKELLSYLGEERKSIDSEAKAIKDGRKALMDSIPKYDKDGIEKAAKEFDQFHAEDYKNLADRRASNKAVFSKVAKQLGIVDDQSAQPPAPAKTDPSQPLKNGAPYKDGTKLKGKDGKFYVVQNGAPILQN